jgi:serine/threonine protein kinase/tetratricopeptide (TPR) repeat protein/TolB-like protein
MKRPSAERWQRIERLVDTALDLPPSERAAWLRTACADDPALEREVLALLDAGERDDAFLAVPLAPARQAAGRDVPERIGSYRILGEIGRGGMGVVYLAEREAHFEQRVALKLVRSGLPADDHVLKRFVEERQILASLEHANIARLLDGGVTEDGAHWFAMELVEGEPLDRWCNARQLPVEARLELFLSLCDAVEYAHRRRIVHRDIKPSNVLVRRDGTLKLLDFGIAKLVADDADGEGLTRTGGRLLTPEYASPEQIRGDVVTAASDVYSLGAILYELLTGRRPYRVPTRLRGDLERAVLDHTPTPPSAVERQADVPNAATPASDTSEQIARDRATTPDQLATRLRGALDEIVLRALAKDPRDRYASARAFGADVERHLRGEAVTAPTRSPRARRYAAAGGLVIVATAVLLTVARFGRDTARKAERALPITAVGLVADYRDSSTNRVARSLADLLATNLARIPSLRVVSTARLYEVMAQLGTSTAADAGAYSGAARQAGATTLIDGGLYSVRGDSLRLDLRRIDLATGNVTAVFTISGKDVFTLVDRTTAALASQLGSAVPDGSVADVTTHSEVASRFYEEGLRAYYYGDVTGSRRLFEAALADDSTLAMAEYYLGLVNQGAPSVGHLQRALRLAGRASDRERLIIRSFWMLFTADPAAMATTETLTVRYPQELEGHRLAAKALNEAGDFSGAARRLRDVMATDSMALRGLTPRCSSCDARYDLVGVYLAMDSLTVAEREARLGTQLKRVTGSAWLRLGDVLLARGNVAEARDAYSHATEIDRTLIGQPSYFAYFYLPGGDYETADRALGEIAQSGSPDRRAEANWYLTLSLREQGRRREALEAAKLHRAQMTVVGVPGPREQVDFQYAQVLFELGRHREAAAVFDSIARAAPGFSESHKSRHRSWALTHAATAVSAAGDTTSLRQRIDSIRVIGSRSLLARDQRLHHYARGLLLVARGQDVQAVDEFRLATVSPLIWFTRINYELARALMRVGRARDAVTILQPAVRGPLESSNLYVTHTELRELLARAWDLAGVADSAVAHYRLVLRAWQRADPALGARVDSMRTRVAALTSSR